MRKDKKDPSKLYEWGGSHFDGKIAGLIENLQSIVKQHPNATIEFSMDRDDCYYESDWPNVRFTIRSK